MNYHFYRVDNKTNGWIRIGHWLLVVKSSRPLFSERNGYVKYYRVGFGYRVRLYKEKKP